VSWYDAAVYLGGFLTAERLRELIAYDPATGVFTWIAPPRPQRAPNVSGFLGVRRSRDRKKWTAGIGLDGGYRHLGSFESQEAAANAYWLAQCQNGDKPAGCFSTNGGLQIMITTAWCRRNYQASRLAWLYMTDSWPVGEIDHANCDRTDNRWANLRLATRSQNQANTRPRAASGLKGAYPMRLKWQAKIKRIYLGTFDTPARRVLRRCP
jgi:hypothetical protein